jgi:hypothetical protein
MYAIAHENGADELNLYMIKECVVVCVACVACLVRVACVVCVGVRDGTLLSIALTVSSRVGRRG